MREITDEGEDILEHAWIVQEEQKQRMGREWAKNGEELKRLEEMGLVEVRGEWVELTETGRREGRHCIRRHRLAERLLHDILDSEEEEIHAAGCKFEHGLHRGLEEKVCTMLGHPKTCPHGRTIPRGECCKRSARETGPMITTLAEMKKGEHGVVAYLHSEEGLTLRKLMAMGALPGTKVTLVQRFPSYLVELGQSEFAIDEEMARGIYVRRMGE